jgi:preprotein translocase subunit SecA
MLGSMLTKVVGSRNDRLVRRMMKVAHGINELEAGVEALTDESLRARTDEFRQRYKDGETLEQLQTEAFAVVREASRRTLGLRHFDEQLIGGMVLHDGKIAEMRTGEGKTLMATLPAYLNAISGKAVHIVTVNDYLAQRDADWMGKVYGFLGLTVGVIKSGQNPLEKREAYQADVMYGTNNEFGFDYLRDNMAFSAEDCVQRDLGFAIVDEVDSILIDEARTPLIISGPTDLSTDLYGKINLIVPKLVEQVLAEGEEDGPGDYSLDEKTRQAYLTEEGHEHAEELLTEAGLLELDASLYDVASIALLHHLYAALRAHKLFSCDVDYIVNNDEIVIIDEFTGRMMSGRRWSDGLHQAVEAKEGVSIQQENQTLASITFQNYFRLYDRLSGMTGTADTEAVEFHQIYTLEVVVIPTHKDMIREDQPDLIYRTLEEKFQAILEDVRERHKIGQPVLLGTASIEVSELLSDALKKGELVHEVLNAKQHEREADIIAQAGAPGSVTIATNMAGRGTDIVLGGNLERELEQLDDPASEQETRSNWQQRHDNVVTAGGLYVVGTERHESRRIDNQLRGRSGRQGDPGESRFYLSMDDSLMRIFGSERISNLMQKLGMEEGEAIEHPWVTRAIENAQRKVEGRNFDVRKQLLEYDDVANEQRKLVYEERRNLMRVDDVSENIETMREDVVHAIIDQSIPPRSLEEQWSLDQLQADFEREFGLRLPAAQWLADDKSLHEETLRQRLLDEVQGAYDTKCRELGEPLMRHLEKSVTLQVLDTQWKEHLASMDYLRQGIGLRGYAQKNPKQEYKREAFEMFSTLLERVKHEVVALLSRVQVRREEEVDRMDQQKRAEADRDMKFLHPSAGSELATAGAESPGSSGAEPGTAAVGPVARPPQGRQQVPPPQPFVRDGRKIGRNEPCPCGSGKKYKQCHGVLNR